MQANSLWTNREDQSPAISDAQSQGRGQGKPETFNFLGFTLICGRSRFGNFVIKRKTRRDRLRTKLKEIKELLRRRRHQPIPEQGQWLRQVINGPATEESRPGRPYPSSRVPQMNESDAYSPPKIWKSGDGERRHLRRHQPPDRGTDPRQ